MTALAVPGRADRRSRPGAWALAGLAAAAFVRQPQFAGMRRGPLRLVFWAQLGLGDVRADENGTAVCGLSGASSSRPRMLGCVAALAGLLVLAGLWATMQWTWPVWSVFVVAGWLYWPIVRHSARGIGARRALARCRPPGRVVTVHTVASCVPGAGARLLERVAGEADLHAWTLVLVAANERLAGYYERFGFAPTGRPVRMPSGETAVPMARRHASVRGVR